ncbi:hypothetical protein BCR39DRAFT_538739 [Naematelia encephala]|uniref:SET domain-containing protein n=1 Tax=Naematelia encephala TaxID=71784 RepID=A0A1Y2AZ87_9TREE|nr:hypothetical protein BCR39DRAFT_538739 [Naematelia encephala]
MSMPSHGLLEGHPPPSRELLAQWLDAHGVIRNDGLDVIDMEDGSGWTIRANRDIEMGEALCQIPKSAVLSSRSSSLPPLPVLNLQLDLSGKKPETNNHTILFLALALLHEFRLGAESKWYGYLQSLPREPVLLPVLWEEESSAGQGGRIASGWLKGTEAEKELRRKDAEGLSLGDIRQFYLATAQHLPPTTCHPAPSPESAFLYAYSLVSTRAFIIDLYHIIALCPFADLFNHSSLNPHSSLTSDDFVCHICGSLTPCSHDVISTSGVVMRLDHLGDWELRRITEDGKGIGDCVEMRAEREIAKGEEVYNCYGEGMGDARLLVEWGFVGEEFAGDGITWDVDELSLKEDTGETVDIDWSELAEKTPDAGEETERLIGSSKDRLLNLAQSGEISLELFAHLFEDTTGMHDPKTLLTEVAKMVEHLQIAWMSCQDGNSANLTDTELAVARRIVHVFDTRLGQMRRSDFPLEELFELRDSLPSDTRCQQMALTLTINERSLLQSARQKWVDLLEASKLRA